MDSVMIDGHNADFFHTASTGPQKALVMLGGSEGGRYWSYHPELIRDLVDQGFCILSLPYFGTRDLPHDLRSIPLEYFARVFRWLSTQKDQVIPDNYALVGVSEGRSWHCFWVVAIRKLKRLWQLPLVQSFSLVPLQVYLT